MCIKLTLNIDRYYVNYIYAYHCDSSMFIDNIKVGIILLLIFVMLASVDT